MDGVAKILYSNGEHLHFKKYSQIHSIVQNDTENGIKYNLHTQHGTWNGLRFWCPIDYDDPYIVETLLSDICYYRIKRRMFPSGYRYYLEIVLKDKAPQKISKEELCSGNGGVDMGTSTIAFVSDNNVLLERLAPDVNEYNREIKKIQKRADKLNRALNPQYFKGDGTAIKRKKNEIRDWKSSRKLQKLRRMIATLYRKKTEYIRQSHYIVANKIVKSCDHVYYEKVSVSG